MPAEPTIKITISIPPELYTWLSKGNMTQTIINAQHMRDIEGETK